LLSSIGFAKLESEPSVYAHPAADNSTTILVSYVDDFLIAVTPGCAEKVQGDIMSIMMCKDLGLVSSFLGIQVDCDRTQGTVILSSPRYIWKIVHLMGMQDSKYANTLASHTSVLLPCEPGTLALDYPYLSAIGRLLWLALTVRPDIAYIIRALARHTQSYTQAHITAIKRVLRYLNHTSDISICYGY
jgi:hypothetical protein